MAQRVFLHVGTPKSGTTYLQDLLWQRREELLAHDVLVPGRTLFDHNRASQAVRHGLHLPGATGHVRRARTWQRVREQADAHDGTVVLSNEWWPSASDDHLRVALDQLGGDRVHVVVTTRSPVRLVPAAWQESLKVGRGHALDDFVESLSSGTSKWGWDALDPHLVAQRWAALVGPGRVHVVTLPTRPAHRGVLWERFAACLGMPAGAVPADLPDQAPERGGAPAGVAAPRPGNESLSVQAARLLQEYGPALRAEVDEVDASWSGHSRWLRVAVVRDVLAGLDGDAIGVGPGLAADLEARAERSVAGLRALGCPVTGDLEDLLGGTDREGARHPGSVTDAELVEVGRHLAAGLLRARIHDDAHPAGPAPEDEPPEDEPPQPAVPAQPAQPAQEPASRAPQASAPPGRPRHWTFLVPSAYAAGGIARTVFTTADVLVRRGCEVTVITLVRSSAEPALELNPAVRLVPLQDRYDPADPEHPRPRTRRDPAADPRHRELDGQPSSLATAPHKTFTGYVDLLLEQQLSALPPGVVVTTRPEFAVAASRWCDPGSVLLHQEHLSFLPRPEPLRAALRDLVHGVGGARPLDALLTLTDADLERWRDYLGPTGVRTGVIPNPTPFPVGDPAPLRNKVVIAAGRMTRQKGFERLIAAWVPLATSHPDWQLRIFGDGTLWEEHRAQVEQAGVGDRILLGGVTHELERELAESSLYAMSSRYEGLPMVLLEALSKGVPPVSFDCPEGPRQLIQDGRNGVLVPQGDVPALTGALRRLMDDEDLRRRLGAAALESARAYQAEAVVDRWEDLVAAIGAERRGT